MGFPGKGPGTYKGTEAWKSVSRPGTGCLGVPAAQSQGTRMDNVETWIGTGREVPTRFLPHVGAWTYLATDGKPCPLWGLGSISFKSPGLPSKQDLLFLVSAQFSQNVEVITTLSFGFLLQLKK